MDVLFFNIVSDASTIFCRTMTAGGGDSRLLESFGGTVLATRVLVTRKSFYSH